MLFGSYCQPCERIMGHCLNRHNQNAIGLHNLCPQYFPLLLKSIEDVTWSHTLTILFYAFSILFLMRLWAAANCTFYVKLETVHSDAYKSSVLASQNGHFEQINKNLRQIFGGVVILTNRPMQYLFQVWALITSFESVHCHDVQDTDVEATPLALKLSRQTAASVKWRPLQILVKARGPKASKSPTATTSQSHAEYALSCRLCR